MKTLLPLLVVLAASCSTDRGFERVGAPAPGETVASSALRGGEGGIDTDDGGCEIEVRRVENQVNGGKIQFIEPGLKLSPLAQNSTQMASSEGKLNPLVSSLSGSGRGDANLRDTIALDVTLGGTDDELEIAIELELDGEGSAYDLLVVDGFGDMVEIGRVKSSRTSTVTIRSLGDGGEAEFTSARSGRPVQVTELTTDFERPSGESGDAFEIWSETTRDQLPVILVHYRGSVVRMIARP